MCDEDDWRLSINSNLVKLTECTYVSIEMLNPLKDKGVIVLSEYLELNSTNLTVVEKAIQIYTEISMKWDEIQFEEFLKALKVSGNNEALKVLSVFLTKEHIQILHQHRYQMEWGCYEGLCYQDEMCANKVVKYAKGDQVFKECKIEVTDGAVRKDLIGLLGPFKKALVNNVIWWNKTKAPLLSNYIPRSIVRTATITSNGTSSRGDANATFLLEDQCLRSGQNNCTWEAAVGDDRQKTKLMLLVDSCGNGKTYEVTHLVEALREKVKANRVIAAIYLNKIQDKLKTVSSSDTASDVLVKLAPFLYPLKRRRIQNVRMFVILDGLDEVCPECESNMHEIFRIFQSSKEFMELTVVVTTRPHLKESLETKFKFESWSLLPLTSMDQKEYIKKTMGWSMEQAEVIRHKLPASLQSVLGIPQMLIFFTDFVKSKVSVCADLNIYDLVSHIVSAMHEMFLVQKMNIKAGDNFTETELKLMLTNKLPLYNHVALNRLSDSSFSLPHSFTKTINLVARKSQIAAAEITHDERTSLLYIGLLVEESNHDNSHFRSSVGERRLDFKYRVIMEHFYARMVIEDKNCPQEMRDAVLRFICEGKGAPLENVEALLLAAVTSRRQEICNAARCILSRKNSFNRCRLLKMFTECEEFPFNARDILVLSFAVGHAEDLWETFCFLLERRFSYTVLERINTWMTMSDENRYWTRDELFQISEGDSCPVPPTRLMVAIGVTFECQNLLSTDEVGSAIMACDKLVYITASIETRDRKVGKWDYVEGHLLLKGIKLKELMRSVDDDGFSKIIEDSESVSRLFAVLTRKELDSFVTKKETPTWFKVLAGGV